MKKIDVFYICINTFLVSIAIPVFFYIIYILLVLACNINIDTDVKYWSNKLIDEKMNQKYGIFIDKNIKNIDFYNGYKKEAQVTLKGNNVFNLKNGIYRFNVDCDLSINFDFVFMHGFNIEIKDDKNFDPSKNTNLIYKRVENCYLNLIETMFETNKNNSKFNHREL